MRMHRNTGMTMVIVTVLLAALPGGSLAQERIVEPRHTEMLTGGETFWQDPRWKPLEAAGDYVVYKVNNEFGKDRPSYWVTSHSFLAVYDRRIGKVIETYSYVDTNRGEWEDPYKGQNIQGGEAAIKSFSEQGKWTAKELGQGRELVEVLRAEVSARGRSPETFLPWHNCKVEANHLLDGALQRIAHQERFGGVSMKMNVKEESVRKDQADKLDTLKNNVLDKRPQEDSLSWPAQKKEDQKRICLSMRVLSIEAKKIPLRKEVENLAGIGWLEGFVVDPDNQDVILIGWRAPNWPALHIDDFVVNMRNVWNKEVQPYCSLDPRPENVRKLNELASRAGIVTSVDQMHGFFNRLKEAWGPQGVVVGGVPRNSRHAHVMIDADYHMKKVSQGLVQVDGIRSCLDIVLDEAKRQVDKTGRVLPLGMSMSRFWFHVGELEPTYQESKGIVCLEKCSVVVLTEKQRSTVDGVLYDSVEDDPHANAFAQELSDRFQTAATIVPEYANLENLFRLSAVLRAMHLRDAANQARLDLGFWLKDYRYKRESAMPPSLPGLTNSKEARKEFTQGELLYQYVLFPMACGGVNMEINLDERQFVATQGAQMNQLRELVIRSRPSPGALSWQFPLTSE